MLTGVDIASYQAGISQSVIAQADVVVVKATEGTNYVSPELFDQFSKAVNAGKKVGVYHYAHAGNPVAQADYFIAKTREAQLTPDFWVLDFEEADLLADEDFALRFLDRVHSKTGQVVWFYCYMNQLKQHGYRRIRDAGWKLWLAGYPYGQQSSLSPQMTLDEYIVFSGFNSAKWDFAGWQYSSQGRLPGWGGDLDFNVFFEDAFTSVNDKPQTDLSVPSASMVYPAPPSVPISQEFGQNGTSFNLATGGHTGRDYADQMDTPVYAMANGTVLWADDAANLPGDDSNAGWESRWLIHKAFAGVVVVIDHGTFLSVYAHLNRTDLNVGDTVRAGQQIALSGNTGAATTGPHLHWEVIPQPYAWWTNGYFGRVHPGKFLESNKASVASVAVEQKDEFDMATLKDLEVAVNNVIHQNDGFFREKVHQVLRESVPKQTAGLPGISGSTDLILEASYTAANHKRTELRFDEINSRLDRLEKLIQSNAGGTAVSTSTGGATIEEIQKVFRREVQALRGVITLSSEAK